MLSVVVIVAVAVEAPLVQLRSRKPILRLVPFDFFLPYWRQTARSWPFL